MAQPTPGSVVGVGTSGTTGAAGRVAGVPEVAGRGVVRRGAGRGTGAVTRAPETTGFES